jgi:hypothetical protein
VELKRHGVNTFVFEVLMLINVTFVHGMLHTLCKNATSLTYETVD